MGAKIRLNGTSTSEQTHQWTDGRTDIRTDGRKKRLIESIGQEGRCFEKKIWEADIQTDIATYRLNLLSEM